MSEENENKTDPRFYAIRNAAHFDRNEAARLLAEDPTLINVRNSLGETAFHFLVVENDLEGVAWLLAHGSDVNTRNDFGSTPFSEAASLGYIEMCHWLLNNGADMTIRSENDDTALSDAAMNAQLEVLQILLDRLPPNTNINDYFHPILAEMILEKEDTIAEILRARGLRIE